MNLIVIGINHRTAGVDIREQYAVAPDDLAQRCTAAIAESLIQEAVILSTCNRVEWYLLGAPGASTDEVQAAAQALLGPAGTGVYFHTGMRAVRHLFHVASSLDSMVVGEPQILGQIKEAFHVAQNAGSVGAGLERCFSRAFRTAKKVRNETTIARSAVSVGYVAVELAKTIFGDVQDVKVLLIGAGKMGVLAARNLADSGAHHVLVVNRTYERGQTLAKSHGWSARAYEELPSLLESVDVVICSTGASRPVLTEGMVATAVKARRYRPLFLIDIAVPRDIQRACGALDDVYLYDIDDLEEVSRTNAEGRAEAAEAAKKLIEMELQKWARLGSERQVAPTIRQLREHFLAVATAEVDKTLRMLPELEEASALKVQKLAEVVVGRMLRAPIRALKDAAGAGEAERLAAVVHELFDLENGPDES